MRIKKHTNRNDYALTPEGIWVRNLTKKNAPSLDINDLAKSDFPLLLNNELENNKKRYPYFEFNQKYYDGAVIVSDGYNFIKYQEVLATLPKNIIILAVNRSLANWKLVGNTDLKKSINYYVVNNPFQECNMFLPQKHRYYPKCIASCRTNPSFLEEYRGEKYLYRPTSESYFNNSLSNETEQKIDDYRNPICAAVSLAETFKVNKIAMFCCDASFDQNMSGSIKLENELYCYPQQITSQNILDNMFYWLKTNKKISIVDCSMGIKYKNAPYINLNKLNNFFEE